MAHIKILKRKMDIRVEIYTELTESIGFLNDTYKVVDGMRMHVKKYKYHYMSGGYKSFGGGMHPKIEYGTKRTKEYYTTNQIKEELEFNLRIQITNVESEL